MDYFGSLHDLKSDKESNGYANHKIILDSNGNPIDYVFLEINETFENLTGLKREKVIGKKVTEVIPGIKKSKFDWVGIFGKVALDGISESFVQYSKEQNKWFKTYAFSKEKNHFVTITSDVTAFKSKEQELINQNEEITSLYEELSASEEDLENKVEELKEYSNSLKVIERRLNKAQSLAKVGNWELDLQTKKMWASEEAFRLYDIKYESPYLPLQEAQKVVHVDDRARMDEALKLLLGNNEKYDITFRIVRPNDHGERILHSVAELEFDVNGKPIKVLGVLQDVTESKTYENKLLRNNDEIRALNEELTASEEELKQQIDELQMQKEYITLSEKRWKTALEGNNAVLYEIDFLTGKVFLSDRWAEYTGFGMECVPKSIEAFNGTCHPDDLEMVNKALNEHLNGTTEIYQVEHRIRCKAGYKWIHCRGKAIWDENGKAVRLIGSEEDIDIRKSAEEALRKAKNEAELANLTKSQFLANMSHEIRTPMNGIMGMIQLTLETRLDETQKKHLILACDSTGALLRIIDDVLDYSKMEAGKVLIENKPFNVAKILNELVTLFNISALQKGIEILLKNKIEESTVFVGDAVRIRQILSNIIGNAVKFTPHGKITITAHREYVDNDVELRFSIMDTGIGIPPNMRDLLFERFNQLDSSYTKQYQGTGLGLAISKNLTELMGGQIWVESDGVSGSTFHFTVRVKEAQKGFVETDAYEITYNNDVSDDKKVLVVEDDAISRYFIKTILEKNFSNIITAENGEEALKVLLTQRFDLILMDIQMPVLDGLTATQMIREKEKISGEHTPIIAMTAYALNGDRERFIDAGMDGYISKPIDAEGMNQLAKKWLVKTE